MDVVDRVDLKGRDGGYFFYSVKGSCTPSTGSVALTLGAHDPLLMTQANLLFANTAKRGYLPQRLATALVTASRIASWRIAHWN